MKSKMIVIILLILAGIILSIGARFAYSKYLSSRGRGQQIPAVVVDTVKEKDVIQSFEAPGRIVSKYKVSILARISGYLQKSYFKEGDYVKEGDVLFLIEPAEFQNASNVAGATVQNIKAQLDYANKQLARAEELVKKDYIAKSRYDEILANRDALQAQLKAAQSNYKDTNRNLGYTKIKAPVDGRIGIIDVTIGNYVTPTSGSLTTINSTNPIYVTFPLPSSEYIALTKSDTSIDETRKAELYFQNGEKYEYDGVQDFLDNKVDDTTGTVTMRATFQNPKNRLLNGEFVNIKLFANNKTNVPVVPVTAVQENQEGKYVYKIDENGLPQLTYIKVNGQTGKNWIITNGLKPGDKIIVDGILKVMPGLPVKVVTKEEMAKLNKALYSEKKD